MPSPTNKRDSLFGSPAEERSTVTKASAPRDRASTKKHAKCLRQVPRQATSMVAFAGPFPDQNDPLLQFTPVPHTAPRRNSITPDLQRAFIAHLAATGIVKQAARHIGRSLEALYKLRQRPGAEEFRAAWDAAIDRGVSRLESCALARAIEGEERMVVSAGKLVGTEIRHNEALVMFFLRSRLPERYGPVRDTPSEEIYAELEAKALAAARELVRRERSQQVGDLIHLLDHMVQNRLEGRAYITGIDTGKTIAENATLIRARGP